MVQSTQRPLHVAVIMDGNGRWARRRGLPRSAGHRAGAGAVTRTVEAAPGLGIGTLSLYAFSADNWKRPPREVACLMALLQRYLRAETARAVANGVRLVAIGRRDRLPAGVVRAIASAEAETARGARLLVRLALDYSSRASILEAVRRCGGEGAVAPDDFSAALAAAEHAPAPAPPVDLLVRTGGEQRLSDFLLWESAYAELLFLDHLWPDFDAPALADAVRIFHTRERRFGGLPLDAAS